jgi:hypothetical protein
MPLPAEFSLLHSELNDFLFAPLGEEESGAPLSVLSALTRLDMDPWAEAARLAAMPREAAVGVLVPLIARFPKEQRTSAEVRDIAGRLAELLPLRRLAAFPAVARSDHRRSRRPIKWLIWLGLGVALITMAASRLLLWQ